MHIHNHFDHYTVDGVSGKFRTEIQNGWVRIHHTIADPEDPYGALSERHFVGSVCRGRYADDEGPAIPNTEAREQIEEKIRDYVHRRAAAAEA